MHSICQRKHYASILSTVYIDGMIGNAGITVDYLCGR